MQYMGPSYAKEILNIGITFTQDLEIFKIKININLRYINESGKLNIQHYLLPYVIQRGLYGHSSNI